MGAPHNLSGGGAVRRGGRGGVAPPRTPLLTLTQAYSLTMEIKT